MCSKAVRSRLRLAACSRLALTVAIALVGAVPAAVAFDPAGTKRLLAHPRGGEPIPLGHVHFTPQPDGRSHFELRLDTERFTDHFLSMKEFKCLGGDPELACHVPYPYAQPGVVGPGDWTWLEHSLLFLYKQPREFGARLWNGVYYRFEADGPRLVGRPQAVDLNRISAPPADPSRPPFGPAQRDDMAAGARWLERLTIE